MYKDMSYLVTTCKKQMYIYMFCEWWILHVKHFEIMYDNVST